MNEKINNLIDDKVEDLLDLKNSLSKLEDSEKAKGKQKYKSFPFSYNCLSQCKDLYEAYYKTYVCFFESIMCNASYLKITLIKDSGGTKEWNVIEDGRLLKEGKHLEEAWNIIDDFYEENDLSLISLEWRI